MLRTPIRRADRPERRTVQLLRGICTVHQHRRVHISFRQLQMLRTKVGFRKLRNVVGCAGRQARAEDNGQNQSDCVRQLHTTHSRWVPQGQICPPVESVHSTARQANQSLTDLRGAAASAPCNACLKTNRKQLWRVAMIGCRDLERRRECGGPCGEFLSG